MSRPTLCIEPVDGLSTSQLPHQDMHDNSQSVGSEDSEMVNGDSEELPELVPVIPDSPQPRGLSLLKAGYVYLNFRA